MKKIILGLLLLLLGGCGSFFSAATDDTQATFTDTQSDDRQNAMKMIQGGPTAQIRIDILQQDLSDNTQSRLYPLGKASDNISSWKSLFGGPKMVTVYAQGEFDVIASSLDNETDYIVGMGNPYGSPSSYNDNISQIDFTFAAVNPHIMGHYSGAYYGGPWSAWFPSNSDNVSNRSLLNLNGGDVAILVRGIQFRSALTGEPNISVTKALVNGLGDNASIFYMRDNAYMSGRFFAVPGAVNGRAPFMNYPVDNVWFFNSVQVPGDAMDLFTEPGSLTSVADVRVGSGAPAQGKSYAFLDLCNQDETDNATPTPGRGGFLFVLRREAFNGTKVVINPGLNAGSYATDNTSNLAVPPPSGYDETNTSKQLPPISVGPWRTDNRYNDGATPGVQTIGLAVLFTH